MYGDHSQRARSHTMFHPDNNIFFYSAKPAWRIDALHKKYTKSILISIEMLIIN